MRVKFLRAHDVRIGRLSKLRYDAGNEASIDDAIAQRLVADGIAIDLDADAAAPSAAAASGGADQMFTPDQAAVLRAIADDVLARMAADAQAHAQATAGETAPDAGDGEPIVLADLSLDELRAIGVELEIKGAARMSKAKLVAAIEKMQADAADAAAGASDGPAETDGEGAAGESAATEAAS